MKQKPKSTIAIFRNARKKTENHPDFNAKIKLDEGLPAGEYEVGLYIKESKAGTKYFSGVNIRPAFKKDEGNNNAKADGYQKEQEVDEEIPF